MSYLTDMDDYANDVVTWHDREWPSPDGSRADIARLTMKLAEEVGELSGALVKYLQGRTDSDWVTKAEDEFGDVVIVMMVLADRIRDLSPKPGGKSFERMFKSRWLGRGGGDGGVSSRRGATYRQASSNAGDQPLGAST